MNRKVAVTIILIFLAVIALFVQISTTTLEFSRYNWAWNGTSDLFAELDAHNAHDLVSYDELAGRNDTLLLIIAPSGSFSQREILAIEYFVKNGNTLFIADETGTSNHLLSAVNSSIRIKPGKISSMQSESLGFSFVIAYPREPDPLLTDVSTLTLNMPSVVNGGEILVSTSFLSWEDFSIIDIVDINESLNSFGILARERIGNSTIYVFSDPSIFVNGMQNGKFSSNNEIFIQNLLSLRRDIIVEQSHTLTGEANSILATAIWIKNATYVKISVLFISILFVAVAFNRKWI